MADEADALIGELDAAECWPLEREQAAQNIVRERRALRKGIAAQLKLLNGWDGDRPYVHDALARRIAFGFADFLFGQDPDITAANESDQGVLDEAVEENRMPARLHRAARLVVSEGEAWWKLHVNTAVAPCALLTWTSRLYVVPRFYGDRVTACAFITQRARVLQPVADQGTSMQPAGQPLQFDEIIYRHAEVHTTGRVVNLLYKGTPELLGRRVALTERPETAGYAPEWRHGLDMLAGRVVNDLEDDDTLGVSDYDQVRDELLALDEAVSIAVENTRLTAVDRVAVSGSITRQDGSFDASMQVLTVNPDGGDTLGEAGKGLPLVHLEKRYDAVPLWLHIDKLVRSILRNVGLVAEFVGDDASGHEQTGVAIRLRFIPTVNAAEGKLREWRHDLPHILTLILQIAALDKSDGGFGQNVTAPADPPSVEFADVLPQDESETTTDVATAVAGEVMSRRTAIETLHPEWTDDQVQDELDEIKADLASEPVPPVAPSHASPGGSPPPVEDPAMSGA